ncbi:MAG: hypothetical protein EXR47_01165 [Dehalococcoidia bacterium]|nr:hypothetical protein [Dehalococcoidia bacterium]
MVEPKHEHEEFSQKRREQAVRMFQRIIDLEDCLEHGEELTYDALEDLRAEYEHVTGALKFTLGLGRADLKLRAMKRAVQSRDFIRAYEDFVSLIQPVPAVRYVAGMNEENPDIFAFIERRDEAVCRSIFESEDRIAQSFPRLNVDFHITYLEGCPIEAFLSPPPSLFFARETWRA